MAVTAQGATFTFTGQRGQFSAKVTSLSVSSPQAEVVDMTGPDDPVGHGIMVPTGDWSGGSIDVEYIASAGGFSPDEFVCDVGTLTFSSSGLSVTKQVILTSAQRQASVGELVRGSLRFALTDY